MWKNAYLESRVLGADPVELVNILYEFGIRTLQDARRHLASGDIALRAKAICKVISVISELQASLDHSAGGQISGNLARLYEYMTYRLTMGNLQQADEPLAEVEQLLHALGEAWQTISGKQPEVPDTPARFDPVKSNIPFLARAEVRGVVHGWSA